MPLLSRTEFIRALVFGGLAGVVCAFLLSIGLRGNFPNLAEFAASAWVGFSVVCATMMIRNSGPWRGHAE